jgi:surface protein
LQAAYPTWPACAVGALCTTCITDATVKAAVHAWFVDPTTATATYGPIGDWDTSAVTSMAQLFYNKPTFNSDISKWNVASVTTMSQRHAPWLCMHYAAT